MLELTDELRFYFYNGKTNMRGGYRRLCETIRMEMKADPENASNVYVFMNRRRTIVRMLHYERGFYVLYEKRPSSGRFRKPVFDSKTADTKSATRISSASQRGLHALRYTCRKDLRKTLLSELLS